MRKYREKVVFMKQRIGAYLIDAIHRAGVDKIFGVPGDFNLAFQTILSVIPM